MNLNLSGIQTCFYISVLFLQKTFILSHLDLFLHASSDVEIVDYVFTIKIDADYIFSSRKFPIADVT